MNTASPRFILSVIAIILALVSYWSPIALLPVAIIVLGIANLVPRR